MPAQQTDLLRFDHFTASAGIETHEPKEGFLPMVQIRNDTHAVTFFFRDDGAYDGFSASILDGTVLDVADRVLVIRTEPRTPFDPEQLRKKLKAARANTVLIITDGTTIEALDEEQMRAAGWVRA